MATSDFEGRQAYRIQPTIIEPPAGWTGVGLHELWAHRELLFFLAWRDISVRYKQTVLGGSWAILQPLAAMLMFSVFFGGLIGVPSDGYPYPVFAFAALLPWQYFSTAVTTASQSLVNNQALLTKVYFPRLLIPFASVLPAAVDFALAFVILLGLMWHYDISVTANILWVPLLLLLALATALGVGLWISAANVQYRDFRYIVPFLVQIWLFASPVIYPFSIIPASWRWLYSLNPMVGVIEGFRWALLDTGTPPIMVIVVSMGVTLLLLASGVLYFRRTEAIFSDVI